jgi:hypothetical protein
VTQGTDLGGSGRKGLTGAGFPQWRKPSGGERWWWHLGAAKDTGKGVEGAPGVGAELGAVLGGVEGTEAAVHGGSMMASTAAQWWQ